MTRLVWGSENQKKYETGVDRGVLYPSSGSGVVWNGLVSVEESYVGGENTSFYFDGIKYLDIVGSKIFQATLTAFSAPAEFSPSIGERSLVPGFVITRQPRLRFGFSYRVLIGDELGYKLHVVYNALANPDNRGYETLSENASVKPLTWNIDATPLASDIFKPSAHIIFDSTKVDPDILAVFEEMLYGSETSNARLPGIDEFIDIMALWEPLLITPDTLTGLATLTVGGDDLYRTQRPGINRALPTTHLQLSGVDGLYNYV